MSCAHRFLSNLGQKIEITGQDNSKLLVFQFWQHFDGQSFSILVAHNSSVHRGIVWDFECLETCAENPEIMSAIKKRCKIAVVSSIDVQSSSLCHKSETSWYRWMFCSTAHVGLVVRSCPVMEFFFVDFVVHSSPVPGTTHQLNADCTEIPCITWKRSLAPNSFYDALHPRQRKSRSTFRHAARVTRSKAKDFLWSKVEYQRGLVKLYRCFWMWKGWMCH